MTHTRWLVATGALGVAFGVATSVMNAVSSPYEPLGSGIAGTVWARAAEVASLLLDAGWTWAALAVAAGWLAGSLTRGLIAGPVALVTATIGYFCMDAALRRESLSMIETVVWGTVGLVLGPVLGAVGDSIRRPGLRGALAGLIVPAGAAAQMVTQPPGLAKSVNGWIPNPEADLARLVVWTLAALAAIAVLTRYVRHLIARPAGITNHRADPVDVLDPTSPE